jgi:hypothetical protein
MSSSWYAVVVDSADPARLSRWWAEVLGYQVLDEDFNEVMVGLDKDVFPLLYFVRSVESKAGKNRLHLDLRPVDQDAEVERLIDMGARHVDIGQGEQSWIVLADPEGNEFCVLSAAPA